MLDFGVFQESGYIPGSRACGGRRGGVIGDADQTAGIAHVLVVAIDAIQEVALGVVVAGDGRGHGRENHPPRGIVFVEQFPFLQGGGVVEDHQHRLARGV